MSSLEPLSTSLPGDDDSDDEPLSSLATSAKPVPTISLTSYADLQDFDERLRAVSEKSVAAVVRPTSVFRAARVREPTGKNGIIPYGCVIAGVPIWTESTKDARVFEREPLPDRDSTEGGGCELSFRSHPEFRPNLTPAEVLQEGAFGGSYFRPIRSHTTKKSYKEGVHLEFPSEWFEDLDVRRRVASPTYRPEVNRYRVRSGDDLRFWERKGWMREQDPYGWFQWYCRFYLGRRTEDDDRQVSRWASDIGDRGRWRSFLVSQCVKSEKMWDDETVSPVTRQTLLHWGYEITEEDFDQLAVPLRAGQSVVYLGRVSGEGGIGEEKISDQGADEGGNDNTSSKRHKTG